MATEETGRPAPTDRPVRYFIGDNALYREYDGYPGEILNGTRWESYTIDLTEVRLVDEDEAREFANGVPLDGPNMGQNALDKSGGEGEF